MWFLYKVLSLFHKLIHLISFLVGFLLNVYIFLVVREWGSWVKGLLNPIWINLYFIVFLKIYIWHIWKISTLISIDFLSGFTFLEVWVFKLQQKAITQNKLTDLLKVSLDNREVGKEVEAHASHSQIFPASVDNVLLSKKCLVSGIHAQWSISLLLLPHEVNLCVDRFENSGCSFPAATLSFLCYLQHNLSVRDESTLVWLKASTDYSAGCGIPSIHVSGAQWASISAGRQGRHNWNRRDGKTRWEWREKWLVQMGGGTWDRNSPSG